MYLADVRVVSWEALKLFSNRELQPPAFSIRPQQSILEG